MQDIIYQLVCGIIFFVNYYLFFTSKRSTDYIPSLMYGYFIVLGSAFLSIKTIPYSVGYNRYIFIIFFYVGLVSIDYLLINYKNKLEIKDFNYKSKNKFYLLLTILLIAIPLIHVLIARDIPFVDYISGRSDYNKNRELFSKLLDVNFLVKYIPNYIFSIISPILVNYYYRINKKKIAFFILFYTVIYAILSAAVLPVIIFILITTVIVFSNYFSSFRIFFSLVLIIGFILAYKEASNLHGWINSGRLSTGIHSEYTYIIKNSKDHPILISDINRLSCNIPYEFSESVPQLSTPEGLDEIVFNRFCKDEKLAKSSFDACIVDADCPSDKCRMDSSGVFVCIPKDADCAISAKIYLKVGDRHENSGAVYECKPGKLYEERPTLFFNKLSNILYRLYLVPPDVGFSWFFYRASNNIKFDTSNVLDEFKARANTVGVWAYADRFPTRYLKSVSAYGSFELDGYYILGVKSILISLALYFLIRFFSIFTNSIFYLMTNTLLSIFIWQAGPYSIIISHGLWILLLIGLVWLFKNIFYNFENQ
jgi:hypothetical protein